MNKIAVKIKKVNPDAQIPRYEHCGDSGADLTAIASVVIEPGRWRLVSTGLSAEVPAGYELQVRPRSGLAVYYGVTIINTPGTIDSGYRGEIKVALLNLGVEPFTVAKGQKIAQLVIAPVVFGQFEEVEELSPSTRDKGGFGSTGKFYEAAENAG